MGARSAQTRRDYHNKAERERTRKVNASIKELRALLQRTEDSDKLGINNSTDKS